MELEQVSLDQLQEVLRIYKSCVRQHQKLGFNQWDKDYPSREVVLRDIELNQLFGIKNKNRLIAVVAFTDDEPQEYVELSWENNQNYKIVHRLGVHEDYIGRGLATKLMWLLERRAIISNVKSVRLDTFSPNKIALKLYLKLGYKKVGVVSFRKRTDSNYTCFEKVLNVQRFFS